MTPVVLISVVATAAAATTAAVTLSAASLFQADPQGLNFNGDIETVLPSTVHQIATVNIPDYGQVAIWGATTKPGGFCFALKLPDGDWGGLNISQNAQDGWDGGAIPGCAQTRQQQILKQTPLEPGQPPSGTTGQELMPLPLEQWDNEVKNRDWYAIHPLRRLRRSPGHSSDHRGHRQQREYPGKAGRVLRARRTDTALLKGPRNGTPGREGRHERQQAVRRR